MIMKEEITSPPAHNFKRPDEYTNFQDNKEKILNLDIVDVIENYIQLKPSGANYKGSCPFHNEKTPSLVVSKAKNIWKCFGCGKGGNSINFVMEKKRLTYIEAIKEIAHNFQIDIQEEEETDEQRIKRLHKESLYMVNNLAATYYEENLYKSEHKLILDYARSRWSDETIKFFAIGYAVDSSTGFLNYSRANSIDHELCIKSGLIGRSEDKKKQWDHFQNRLIFPIRNKFGRIVGFSGRIIPGGSNKAKYINSPESDIYFKSEILYGLDTAINSIRISNLAYLVEGNADVLRLNNIGIPNVVATSGIALSEYQINLLKRYTKRVYIIGDTDVVGINAAKKLAEKLISFEIETHLVNLPVPVEDGKKNDADSFFTDINQFNQYVKENDIDYILSLANDMEKMNGSASSNTDALKHIHSLIHKFSDSSLRDVYIESCRDNLKLYRKAFDNLNKKTKSESRLVSTKTSINRTKRDNDSEIDPSYYGFEVTKNGYKFWVGIKEEENIYILKSNFILNPLYHIQDRQNAKRIFEIIHDSSKKDIIDFYQSELTSIKEFRRKLGSLGPYNWWGSESEFHNLTRLLFKDVPTCIEITQLGWQKTGFYAWANGIFDNEFIEIDSFGMVEHNKVTYWIPWLSKFREHQETISKDERNFIHKIGNSISITDYFRKFQNVFGENGIVTISWYIATLFSDYIFKENNFFPILNFYGPTKTGKTHLARTITNFFGVGNNGISYHNSTIAGLSGYVAKFSNAIVLLDEYENSAKTDDKDQQHKIMFVKNLHERIGRLKSSKENISDSTKVDCGVILCGEEKPAKNIAILNRTIHLSFFKSDFTSEQINMYEELKSISEKGLTHITQEILKQREHFIANYTAYYQNIKERLRESITNLTFDSRIISEWTLIIAAFATLESKLVFPFNTNDLIKLADEKIRNQHSQIEENRDVNNFWTVFDSLHRKALLMEGIHYKIEWANTRRAKKFQETGYNLDETGKWKPLLGVRLDHAISLYMENGAKMGFKVRDNKTMKDYLRRDKLHFETIDSSYRIGEEISTGDTFYYKEIGITLHKSMETDKDFDQEDEQKDLDQFKF